MKELWKSLRIGDKVRFVQLPMFKGVRGSGLHPETRKIYEKLIARGYSQRVYVVDEDGLPWIKCRVKDKRGRWEHHFLAVNDDSWVRVKHRQRNGN